MHIRQGGQAQPHKQERRMSTEWLRQHETGGPLMALRDRVHALRKEHGWSQADLATRIGADAA
jgi:ribosome-binding protein aMBF1 (putative translation factor)